jgi:hypothetical protein
MILALGNPAQLTDPLDRFGCACRQIVRIQNQKLKSLLSGTLVALNRPAEYCMTAQVRAFRGSGPLSWWIDQVAYLVHQQRHWQITAAFYRADQRVSRLYSASLTGNLIEACRQCAALY